MKGFAIKQFSMLAKLLLFSSVLQSTVGQSDNLPKLLLISFDGFGWNFLSKFTKSEIPNFQRFMDGGVHVRWVENVFPTVTRPNHMSIVTGLYPESHGIVHNEFYDSSLNETMPAAGDLNVNDSKWVDVGAEPIWVTNSKAGNGRRSGSILWPVADAEIKGFLPEEQIRGEWTVQLADLTRQQRVDKALEWLTNPDPTKSVNFVAVYFPEPDDASHVNGPDSPEVLQEITEHDKVVGYLLDQVSQKGLTGKLNIIITADHGQIPVYNSNYINIDDLVNASWYTAQPDIRHDPMVNLWPKPGYFHQIIGALHHINLHVATKNSLDLEALHYSKGSRIAPIVVYTEPGWELIKTGFATHNGNHGWDPRYCVNMYPLFIAWGPAFKKGVRDGAPFHITDIYPMMCHILDLEPAPNNGSLENVRHILAAKETGSSSHLSSYSYSVAIGVVIVVILVVVIIIAVLIKIRRGRNVTESYRRSFTKAGSTEELMQDGMVILSDEEL